MDKSYITKTIALQLRLFILLKSLLKPSVNLLRIKVSSIMKYIPPSPVTDPPNLMLQI
ncbi:hypothetical protein [Rickettsia oklahomensis]|uniref:Uncharacterized protein n=1 Tax=Rickettsia oklahomensis TaxID=3141789 RepID=A0AAU7BXE6_9RICK